LHLAIGLLNLYTRFEARPDSPLRERGKVYERFERCLIIWRSPDRAEELIAVFNHIVINLRFTGNKSTMYTSYYDKV